MGAGETTGSVAGELDDDITGAVEDDPGVDIEVVDEEVAEEADAAVLARAAWCRAARWRFLSLSAGPRCRGWRGGEEGGGAGDGGREWGAPGLPRWHLKATVVTPLLVARLRLASPRRAQTEINSVTEAITNCEFDLDDMFTNCYSLIQGQVCEPRNSCDLLRPGVHH